MLLFGFAEHVNNYEAFTSKACAEKKVQPGKYHAVCMLANTLNQNLHNLDQRISSLLASFTNHANVEVPSEAHLVVSSTPADQVPPPNGSTSTTPRVVRSASTIFDRFRNRSPPKLTRGKGRKQRQVLVAGVAALTGHLSWKIFD